jgi:hypothetical protein
VCANIQIAVSDAAEADPDLKAGCAPDVEHCSSASSAWVARGGNMMLHVADSRQILATAWLGLVGGATLVRVLRGAIARWQFRRVVARRVRAICAAG